MRKKILFLFFFFLLAGDLYSVPLPPKKQQKKIKSQDGVLTELLPDKSIAPRINGRILKKPYVHIQDENQLDKILERHSVNYKNKITILLFWESNCGFCQMILPKLNSISNKYKKSGVNVYAVNPNDLANKAKFVNFLNVYSYTKPVLDEENGKISLQVDSLQKKKLEIPVLFVNQKAKKNFAVTAFPTTYVIDEEGLVYTAMIGFFKEYEEWLTVLIENMLGDPINKKKTKKSKNKINK